MASSSKHADEGGQHVDRIEEEEEESLQSIEKLISQGINAGDVRKLLDAGIYTCNDLMMHTKKNLRAIKGLSEAKVDKICEAAEKLLSQGFMTGYYPLIKDTADRTSTRNQALDDLLGAACAVISQGINAGDVRKLQDDGIYTCGDLMSQTQKNITGIKGLSEAKVYKICEAAEKLLSQGFMTGYYPLIKETVDRTSTGSQAFDDLLGGGIEAHCPGGVGGGGLSDHIIGVTLAWGANPIVRLPSPSLIETILGKIKNFPGRTRIPPAPRRAPSTIPIVIITSGGLMKAFKYVKSKIQQSKFLTYAACSLVSVLVAKHYWTKWRQYYTERIDEEFSQERKILIVAYDVFGHTQSRNYLFNLLSQGPFEALIPLCVMEAIMDDLEVLLRPPIQANPIPFFERISETGKVSIQGTEPWVLEEDDYEPEQRVINCTFLVSVIEQAQVWIMTDSKTIRRMAACKGLKCATPHMLSTWAAQG